MFQKNSEVDISCKYMFFVVSNVTYLKILKQTKQKEYSKLL